MYVGVERVKSDTAVPLKHGDRVCFGVNTDSNDLKYELVCKGSTEASLCRCGVTCVKDETLKLSPSATPPLVKGKRRLSEDQQSGTNRSVPMKKPKLSSTEEKDSGTKIKSRHSVERDCVINITKAPKIAVSNVLTESTPKSTPVVSFVSSSKPSPALSVTSTKSATSDIDELFGGEEIESTAVMDEAIFGEASGHGSFSRNKAFEGRRWMDATTLQIQLAKEEMDKEKHKLLSSIEALRSELAAKDQLLAEKDEKAKVAENVDNSVVSSMQEEFTCVICQELFINAYTLPCAHSFCEWCIKEWMKRKGHKDCPICRKKITSDPVHSLALDNAVDKLVEKLNADEQKERRETEAQHKNALADLGKPKAKATSVAAASSSRSSMTTRSSARRSASPRTATTAHTAGPYTARRTGSPSTARRTEGPYTARRTGGTVIHSSSPRVVIHIDESGRITTRSTTPDHPIVLDTSTESEADSHEESDSSEETDESGSYDSGLHGAYYGGYGRCFNCGE